MLKSLRRLVRVNRFSFSKSQGQQIEAEGPLQITLAELKKGSPKRKHFSELMRERLGAQKMLEIQKQGIEFNNQILRIEKQKRDDILKLRFTEMMSCSSSQILHPNAPLSAMKDDPYALRSSHSLFSHEQSKPTVYQTRQKDRFERKGENLINYHEVADTLHFNHSRIIPILDQSQGKEDTLPRLNHRLNVVIQHKRKIFPVSSIEILSKKSKECFRSLPQEKDITSQQIGGYTQPSADLRLQELAQRHQSKYIFSTSTITPLLSHLYYCISSFRTPHFDNLSYDFNREPFKFMISQRKPNTVFLKKIKVGNKTMYSVNGDAIYSEPGNLVLLKLGKYLERMLTTRPTMIEKRKENTGFDFLQPPPPDFYRYSKINSILVRSQIDCAGEDQHNRPIVFEVKTRASAPIRYDIMNYEDYTNYKLKYPIGFKESYERQFYDLIRGAFLKYCLQMRIGRMQGAFIAYHNTAAIDGFQYLPLQDLQLRLFGCREFAETIYKAVFCLLQKILDYIVADIETLFDEAGEYVRLGFYANEQEHLLNIFVEFLDPESLEKARKGEALIASIEDDPIDVYLRNKVKSKVMKYFVQITPILNGVISTHFPLLFETGDHLDIKYKIQKYGFVGFDQYMSFLHQAFKSQESNITSPFQGTWRFIY